MNIAALHHLMEYLEKYLSLKLDYHKGPTIVTGLDGSCDGTADDPSLVTSFGTTELLSNGNPSSRNQWHSLPLRLRLNIILHRSEVQRLSIFVSC